MSCNACARQFFCDRKECNFKKIRDVRVRRQEDGTRGKGRDKLYKLKI